MRLNYLLLTLSSILISTQIYATQEVPCTSRQGTSQGCNKLKNPTDCENTYRTVCNSDGTLPACKWNGSSCTDGYKCSDMSCSGSSGSSGKDSLGHDS